MAHPLSTLLVTFSPERIGFGQFLDFKRKRTIPGHTN
jgi:hypothetical protein